MNKPLVIDIYHGDPVVDFQAVKDFGILGVIHKATESTGSSDPLYNTRRKAFTDIGMKWGAYHFFHGDAAGSDAKAEADHFLAVSEPDKDTLVSLDWENVQDKGGASAKSARIFLDRIQEKLGRKAVIYSGNIAKEKVTGEDKYFGSHRLWLCQYGMHWKVQDSWEYPWLWQNNGDNFGPGPHSIPGIKGLCDNNCLVDPMTVGRLITEWAA